MGDNRAKVEAKAKVGETSWLKKRTDTNNWLPVEKERGRGRKTLAVTLAYHGFPTPQPTIGLDVTLHAIAGKRANKWMARMSNLICILFS